MIILAALLAFALPDDVLAIGRLDYPAWAQPIPHVLNPLVTPETLSTTICMKKHLPNGKTWIQDQRPPTSYTNKIKFALMDAAGIPRSQAGKWELDHVDPIADGGSPTDPRNLRLQPWVGHLNAREKDKLEASSHRAICAGRLTLDAAQHMLSDDWPAAYRAEFGKDPK